MKFKDINELNKDKCIDFDLIEKYIEIKNM